MREKVLFVDVDDTLIRSAGSKRIPISASIELVRDLHGNGATLYLWSTAGGEYALATAKELGIEGCFTAFLPKPQALIDDVPVESWKLVQLHPNEAASRGAGALLKVLD